MGTVTAHARPEDERLVLDAGCDGYVTKPIQTRTLTADVASFVAQGMKFGSLEELRGAS